MYILRVHIAFTTHANHLDLKYVCEILFRETKLFDMLMSAVRIIQFFVNSIISAKLTNVTNHVCQHEFANFTCLLCDHLL